MDSVAMFVTLCVGVMSIIGLLVKISYNTGSLVSRFGDHVRQADKVHEDQERRLRAVEAQRRQGRW